MWIIFRLENQNQIPCFVHGDFFPMPFNWEQYIVFKIALKIVGHCWVLRAKIYSKLRRVYSTHSQHKQSESERDGEAHTVGYELTILPSHWKNPIIIGHNGCFSFFSFFLLWRKKNDKISIVQIGTIHMTMVFSICRKWSYKTHPPLKRIVRAAHTKYTKQTPNKRTRKTTRHKTINSISSTPGVDFMEFYFSNATFLTNTETEKRKHFNDHSIQTVNRERWQVSEH